MNYKFHVEQFIFSVCDANNPGNNIDVNGNIIRVHIETDDFGHSWMGAGESNDKVVHSFQ